MVHGFHYGEIRQITEKYTAIYRELAASQETHQKGNIAFQVANICNTSLTEQENKFSLKID